VLLTREKEPVGAEHDFAAWKSLCGAGVFVVEKYISKLNEAQFCAMFKQLNQAGIDKVIVLYSGHNIEGKENTDTITFPTLKIKDGTLTQKTVDEKAFGNLFSMAVMGYDSCNTVDATYRCAPHKTKKPGPIVVEPPQLWNFSGKLFYCSCSKGERAFCDCDTGGIFTQKFVQLLKTYDGNWLEAKSNISAESFQEEICASFYPIRGQSTGADAPPKMTPQFVAVGFEPSSQ
jgi:hypothetical protein